MAEAPSFAQAFNKCGYGISESTIADQSAYLLTYIWGHFAQTLQTLGQFCRLIFIYQHSAGNKFLAAIYFVRRNATEPLYYRT